MHSSILLSEVWALVKRAVCGRPKVLYGWPVVIYGWPMAVYGWPMAVYGWPVVVCGWPNRCTYVAVFRSATALQFLARLLSCPLLCNDRCHRAEARGVSTVEGLGHARCCSTTGGHGLDRADGLGDSQLEIFDKVVDMHVEGPRPQEQWRQQSSNFDTADHLGANRGPLLHSIGKVVDIPVVAQRQIPVVRATQKTLVIPQLHYIGKVVDVTVCRLC